MKHIVVIPLFLLLSLMALASAQDQFFYMELKQQGYQIYTSAVPNGDQVLNLIPTTTEMGTSVFGEDCKEPPAIGAACVVDKVFAAEGKHDSDITRDGYFYEPAKAGDEIKIFANTLKGYETAISMNLSLPTFYREFRVPEFEVFLVTQLKAEYTSTVASGFLGLAPYTIADESSNSRQRNESLLWKLHQDAQVGGLVVSFYVNREDDGKTSFMKLGGFDAAGFDSSQEPSTMDTADAASWALTMTGTTYGLHNRDKETTEKIEVGNGQERKFVIDPSLPFIYVPQADFRALIGQLQSRKATLVSQGLFDEANTELNNEYIKFKQSCSDVRQSFDTNISFSIKKSPSSDALWPYSFELQDLLVDGSVFDDYGTADESVCYLGIFSNKGAREATATYAGVLLLQKYYTSFEMSNCQSGNACEPNTITSGLRNTSAQILQSQYNDSAPFHNERPGDQSVWTRYPNEYTEKTVADEQAAIKRYFGSFAAVLFLLSLATVCLIMYQKKQNADRVPDLVFQRNASIYKENAIHLYTGDWHGDDDDSVALNIKNSSSINPEY